MKIGILTWYKAVNHGAVLQAYALQKIVETFEPAYDVCLLDYERKVTNIRNQSAIMRSVLKKLSLRYFIDRPVIDSMNMKKKILFEDFIQKELHCGGSYKNHFCDAVIIGSDMVFNLRQGYSDYMFGKNVKAKKILSYAACAGGTSLQDAENLGVVDEIKNGLMKFSGIGCRDEDTKEFVRKISGRTDTVDTIDPVLLYGFENEKKDWATGKWAKAKPYMLIYAYHGFMNNRTEVSAIKAYANKHGLSIISCGYYHPWCDENINASPCEFLDMFANAACVVTDTFHGTVFSLINKKAFCSIIRGNGYKLRYLLQQSGMHNHIASTPQEIDAALKINGDYERFDRWLNAERSKSLNYLGTQLAEI